MYNGKFMDVMAKTNDMAKAHGYVNGIACAREMAERGVLTQFELNSFEKCHTLRNLMGHGHSADINILAETYNTANAFFERVSQYLLVKNQDKAPNNVQTDERKKALEQQKKLAEERKLAYENWLFDEKVRAGDLILAVTRSDWFISTNSTVPPKEANQPLIQQQTEEYKKRRIFQHGNFKSDISLNDFLKLAVRSVGFHEDIHNDARKKGYLFRVDGEPGTWNFYDIRSTILMGADELGAATDIFVIRPEKPNQPENDRNKAEWLFYNISCGKYDSLIVENKENPSKTKYFRPYVFKVNATHNDKANVGKNNNELSRGLERKRMWEYQVSFEFVINDTENQPTKENMQYTQFTCAGFRACVGAFRAENTKPLYKGDDDGVAEYLEKDRQDERESRGRVRAGDFVIVMTDEPWYYETNSVISPEEADKKNHKMWKKGDAFNGCQWHTYNKETTKTGYVYRLYGKPGDWKFKREDIGKTYTLEEISQIATDVFVARADHHSRIFLRHRGEEELFIAGMPRVSKTTPERVESVNNTMKANGNNKCRENAISMLYVVKTRDLPDYDHVYAWKDRKSEQYIVEGYRACLECFRADVPKSLHMDGEQDVEEYLNS